MLKFALGAVLNCCVIELCECWVYQCCVAQDALCTKPELLPAHAYCVIGASPSAARCAAHRCYVLDRLAEPRLVALLQPSGKFGLLHVRTASPSLRLEHVCWCVIPDGRRVNHGKSMPMKHDITPGH